MLISLLFIITLLSSMGIGKVIGIQFDIEPHSLKDWPIDATNPKTPESRQKINYYGNSLINLYKNISLLKFGNIKVEAVIPFQYQLINIDYINKTKILLSSGIQDVTDKIIIMAYRTTSIEIYNLALPTIKYASKIKKKVTVAIETMNVQPSYISFYSYSNEYMQNVLSNTNNMIINLGNITKGYIGQAIHDYPSINARKAVNYNITYGSLRAIYNWNPDIWLIESKRKPFIDSIIALKFNALYLGIGNYINNKKYWPILRAMVYYCNQVNIDIIMLFGNANWTINHAPAILSMNSFISFVKTL